MRNRERSKVALLVTGILMLAGIMLMAPAQAKKINLPSADVQLTGDITAGPKQARDVIWKTVKGSPKLEVTVHNLPVTFVYGKASITGGDKCFDTTDGVPEAWSGFNLFSDGTVTLLTGPRYFTDGTDVDFEDESLQYLMRLEGTHDLGAIDLEGLPGRPANQFPGLVVNMTFHEIVVTIEGKGRLRRIACTGTFTTADDGFTTQSTFEWK